ncbi:hypothetical protein [Nostocoides australiense]|nr:hypothetical protein [Tetrasphaera australiensis]
MLGPNGAGKTTTADWLARTSGRVRPTCSLRGAWSSPSNGSTRTPRRGSSSSRSSPRRGPCSRDGAPSRSPSW